MELPEKISAWFNTPVYTDGLALLSQCKGAPVKLIQVLSRAETPKNVDKLKYELKKALGTMPKVSHAIPVRTSVAPVAVKPIAVDNAVVLVEKRVQAEKKPLLFNDLPSALRPVYKEAMDLFRENCMLKVELNEVPADESEKAFEIQWKIHQNFERNRACWKKIQYFLDHRTLPPIETKTDAHAGLSPAAQLRRQQQLFSSISNLKKRRDANVTLRESADTVAQRTALDKKIARQDANLIAQEDELTKITKLINGEI
nr:hypothetical protein [uncultured Flavobacterium sp.]